MHLTKVVPFLVEDELMRLGATFEKLADWQPLSVVDGRLITGQKSRVFDRRSPKPCELARRGESRLGVYFNRRRHGSVMPAKVLQVRLGR